MSSIFQHLQRDKYGDGGIYAFYPFDSPLVRRKGVFKVGLALSFDKRLHQYDVLSGCLCMLYLCLCNAIMPCCVVFLHAVFAS